MPARGPGLLHRHYAFPSVDLREQDALTVFSYYSTSTLQSLKAVGVPESLAQPLVYAATLLEVGGGLLLALGFESIGATLLAVFIVCM